MHVENQKIFHRESSEITNLVKRIRIYSNITVKQGNSHEYLGIDLGYSTSVIIKVSMISSISKIINDFPEKITGTATTPAVNYLFNVGEMKELKLLPM